MDRRVHADVHSDPSSCCPLAERRHDLGCGPFQVLTVLFQRLRPVAERRHRGPGQAAASSSAMSAVTCSALVSRGGPASWRLWSAPIKTGTAGIAMSNARFRSAKPSQRRASARNHGKSDGPDSQGPLPPWAPEGAQPSASRAARRSAKTDRPPTKTGGCGRCTGLGSNTMSAKSTNSPWNSGSSAVQSTFIARMYSSIIRPRRLKSTPSALNSPAPCPRRTSP